MEPKFVPVPKELFEGPMACSCTMEFALWLYLLLHADRETGEITFLPSMFTALCDITDGNDPSTYDLRMVDELIERFCAPDPLLDDKPRLERLDDFHYRVLEWNR